MTPKKRKISSIFTYVTVLRVTLVIQLIMAFIYLAAYVNHYQDDVWFPGVVEGIIYGFTVIVNAQVLLLYTIHEGDLLIRNASHKNIKWDSTVRNLAIVNATVFIIVCFSVSVL